MPIKTVLSFFMFLTAGLSSTCSYRFYQSDCDYPLPGKLVKQHTLDSALMETSGLLFMDGYIWTFNDSDGEAAL